MRIDDVYSYRVLVGKCELGLGLGWHDIERLAILERELAHHGQLEQRRYARRATSLMATLRGHRIHDRVSVIEISAGGLVVRRAPFITWNERVEVEIDLRGRCYRFQARGVWCAQDGDDYRSGLALIGIPVCITRARARSQPTADPFDRIETAA